ncbi:hypothetical protein [Chromobacterium alticapitis]|uniref:Uncharacterized protein n=1 Tax=Chromobacterium alticapitis TaxID=2073169 RepID=A0A2S5DD52_9NEIS|nr:hypothetical protein [Chromobacterium alticapitis]POZ60941.1 hypothetical protein C2I19_16220 [Chromobacterium alticapitis]
MRLSGLSATQLDDRYRWFSAEGSHRPCLWHKYLRGTVTPKDTGDRRSIILRVEADFPGTYEIYHHTIWTLLNVPVGSMDEVFRVFDVLREPIRSWLILPDDEWGEDGLFWRTEICADEVYHKLVELQELDAGAALLGLVAESRLCQRSESYYTGSEAFRLWATLQGYPLQRLTLLEDFLI